MIEYALKRQDIPPHIPRTGMSCLFKAYSIILISVACLALNGLTGNRQR